MLLGGSFRAGSPVTIRGISGAASRSEGTRYSRNSVQHAAFFGQKVSLPQGYNSLASVRMPVQTSYKVAARLRGDSSLTANATAAIKATALLQGDSTLLASPLLGLVGSAFLQGESTVTANLTAALKARAILDAGARPSAFDIAQEVWQSQKASYNTPNTMGNALNNASTGGVDYAAMAAAVAQRVIEGGITLEQSLRILLAPLAGKATGIGTGTEIYAKQDGVTPRMTVEFDAAGNRTNVNIDPT